MGAGTSPRLPVVLRSLEELNWWERLQSNHDDLAGLVHELVIKPAWHADALCRQPSTLPATWFPERGDSPKLITAAKLRCAQCPVRDECLEDALADPHREGIWGGTSTAQRAEIRAGRAA